MSHPTQPQEPRRTQTSWMGRPTTAGKRHEAAALDRLMPGETAQVIVPGRWWGGDGIIMVTNARILLQPRMAAMGRKEVQISRDQIQTWKVKHKLTSSVINIKAGRRTKITVGRKDAQAITDALSVKLPPQR